MRYFERQRHEFITQFIKEHGWINRPAICEKFGISLMQASHDIKKWQELNPEWIAYNTVSKRYEAES